MVERNPENAMKGMSRGGFMGNLLLLAGALGLGLLDLSPVLGRAAGPAEPPIPPSSPSRPDGRPRIMPPTGSVKRRG